MEKLREIQQKGRWDVLFCALLLVALAFSLGVACPLDALAAPAPQIRGIQAEGASVTPDDVEVFFGNNVAATSLFDENASHISLFAEDGTEVHITVYRKYFGWGAPDKDNRDPQNLRQFLYVSFPILQPGKTYTLVVSEGVRAWGTLVYGAASATFTTEGQPEGSGGGGSGDGDGSGDGGGSGDGSVDGETGSGESPGSSEGGDKGDGGNADVPGDSDSQPSAGEDNPQDGSGAKDSPQGQPGGSSVAGTGEETVEVTASPVDTASNPVSQVSPVAAEAVGRHFVQVSLNPSASFGGSGSMDAAAQVQDVQNADWWWVLCLLALLVGAVAQRARRLSSPKTKVTLEILTKERRG